MKIVIKEGRVIDPCNQIDEIFDLLIEDGKIKKIEKSIADTAEKVIDAKGMWVVPGLIDMHVHLREPGYEYKETIETGVRSAAIGGFTTICPMPNTKPVTDSETVVKEIIAKAKKANLIQVLPVGSITKNQEGKELAEIEEMVKAGACALSEDGKTVTNAKRMKEALLMASRLNIPVLSHCEDIELVNGGVMNEGLRAEKLGLDGISNDSEEVIVARDIILASSVNAHVHICHISTGAAVQLVREAKLRNEKVTAEATPHHFILDDSSIDGTDSNYKMNPPLRAKKDVREILRGLKDGTIEVIATDHAPHHEDEKTSDFQKAANGIVGLETSLSLCITELVNKSVLSPMELIEKMAYNPARILGLDKGRLSLGADADVTIIDPHKEYTIDVKKFLSKGKNSPFHGWAVKGKVLHTICNGKIIVENGEIV